MGDSRIQQMQGGKSKSVKMRKGSTCFPPADFSVCGSHTYFYYCLQSYARRYQIIIGNYSSDDEHSAIYCFGYSDLLNYASALRLYEFSTPIYIYIEN